MVPAPYQNFLVGSTQASAALIGLLFVSVSIAPERVFGGKAEAERKALALSSFTALANAFFVSFGSLIPNIPLGLLVLVPGVLAASQTLSLLVLLPPWRREGSLLRGLGLFGFSAVIYAAEIDLALALLRHPSDAAALTGLLELLLGVFAIGLARAWELLGAPAGGRGLIGVALTWLRRRRDGSGQETQAAAPKSTRRK